MKKDHLAVKPTNSSNILTIMKKEFARFFGDRRMIFTAMIFPGLMIYVLYTFMGAGFSNMFSADDSHVPVVYVVNLPASIQQAANEAFSFVEVDGSGAEGAVQNAIDRVTTKDIDLCMVFPADFDGQVAAYDVSSNSPAPDIQMYYNSSSENSSRAYSRMSSLLETYEQSLVNKFDVNRDVPQPDTVSEKDLSGSLMSSMLPLLLMVFMFSGCLSLAPESIAGEKERGTIATLLVTPLRRSELAIGKVLSLGCLAFLCGLSSAIGTFLSLPKMAGDVGGVSMNIYSAMDYLSLGLVILSTILLFVTLISIISAYAKTVKEATMTVTPFMILVMLVALTSMFGDAQSQWYYYMIPLYNSVQCMSGIFAFNYSTSNLLIAVATNAIVMLGGAFVLTRLFNSERVMFSK
ncbi:sodium ABC transporter [Clostridia bacterium]|nr:sodium ABC transporter [Clostridia bacterium]